MAVDLSSISHVKRRRVILFAVLFLFLGTALFLWRIVERDVKFSRQIAAAAKRYDVNPLLIKAIVWRESRFNSKARGRSGELGLMQIQQPAAQEWADAEHVPMFDHTHCVDPETNTLAGTFYLSKLLKRYQRADNPLPYALADYNAGRANLLKWNRGAAATNSAMFIEQIGFPGTKQYVKAIMRRYEWYQFLSKFGW